MPEVTIIVAVARNGVIGDGRRMLWHAPGDLAFFKRTTSGHPLVMGRATHDAIGRALPGRHTVVLTRDPDWAPPGSDRGRVSRAASLPEALAVAAEPRDGIDPGVVFVAGGGHVYAEALRSGVVDTVLVSEIDAEPVAADGTTEGLVTFPELDPARWREVSREPHDDFVLVTYRRGGGTP